MEKKKPSGAEFKKRRFEKEAQALKNSRQITQFLIKGWLLEHKINVYDVRFVSFDDVSFFYCEIRCNDLNYFIF